MAETVHAPTPHTIVGIPTPPRTPPSRERATRSMPRLVGQRLLERYQIDAPIGEGGMGLVFRGRHLELDLKVAIKLLRPEFATNPEAVDRFLQEARAASRIRHPNVIEITDFGRTDDDNVFFIMELLDGESLHRTLAAHRRGLPWPRVRHVMQQICDALQAAHDEGVIHRDLKPDNCLRVSRPGDDDFIKVLDFGIAKVRARDNERSTSHTRVGVIVGTPDYIAPEHAKGLQIDHRVDVYAAGVMLYELLTGRLPFRAGSAAETVALHLTEPVPDPCEGRDDIPAALSDIVMRAMAKEPSDRYGSMRGLAEALGNVDDAVTRPALPARRSRAWLAGAIAVGATVAGWGLTRPSLTMPSVDVPTAAASSLSPAAVEASPTDVDRPADPEPEAEPAPEPEPEPAPEPNVVDPAAAPPDIAPPSPHPRAKPKPKPKPKPKKPATGAPRGKPPATSTPPAAEDSGRMSEVKNPFD